MLSGMRMSATETTNLMDAKSGVPFGIPNAELTSTTLLAASVLQTALQDRLTLVFHALRIPMEEE